MKTKRKYKIHWGHQLDVRTFEIDLGRGVKCRCDVDMAQLTDAMPIQFEWSDGDCNEDSATALRWEAQLRLAHAVNSWVANVTKRTAIVIMTTPDGQHQSWCYRKGRKPRLRPTLPGPWE
jgi:hypothetical protein